MLQKLGREKEAQNIYNAVLKAKPQDIGLVAVASNNLLTINRSCSLTKGTIFLYFDHLCTGLNSRIKQTVVLLVVTSLFHKN